MHCVYSWAALVTVADVCIFTFWLSVVAYMPNEDVCSITIAAAVLSCFCTCSWFCDSALGARSRLSCVLCSNFKSRSRATTLMQSYSDCHKACFWTETHGLPVQMHVVRVPRSDGKAWHEQRSLHSHRQRIGVLGRQSVLHLWLDWPMCPNKHSLFVFPGGCSLGFQQH